MYVELHTARLVLRPIGSDDFKTAHKYATDPDVTKYMLFLPAKTEADTLKFLLFAESEWKKAKPDDYEFAICCDGVHIGGIDLVHIGDDVYEIGWIIDKPYQGKGFCTESAKEVVRFAQKSGAKKIIAQCDWRNHASYHVMEKLGMVRTEIGKRTYRDGRGRAKEYTYTLYIC